MLNTRENKFTWNLATEALTTPKLLDINLEATSTLVKQVNGKNGHTTKEQRMTKFNNEGKSFHSGRMVTKRKLQRLSDWFNNKFLEPYFQKIHDPSCQILWSQSELLYR